ncbi:hypothetical protein F5Y05DRAFT_411923 [Hypoxylon sp. FL0543]|nr:hypothetical protein F5Y05DRAFT_411923 [Hypoxylon sp. FL0543]
MYSKAIIVAALAASASAQMRALLPRQTESLDPDLASPTESTSPECESRVESWTAGFPTPPPELEDVLNAPDGGMGTEGVEGLCQFAAGLTKNEASAFISYNEDMYSYLSSQSSNLVAIATSCSADMGAPPSVITSQLDKLLDVYSSYSANQCKDVSATLTSSTPKSSSGSSGFITTALPTLTSSGSGSSSTGSATDSAATSASNSANASGASSSSASTVSQNAGPRETGMLTAAAVAMGVLGAAIAL